MPPQGRPSKQPRRVYQKGGPRIGGKFNAALGGIGKGGSMLFRELTKKGHAREEGSGYFKENPFMEEKKAKQLARKARGSKHQKILTELLIEEQTYDPKQKKQPNFSRNEGNATVARVKEIYGDKVAKEVERKLQGAFGGKHTISGAQAEKHLRSIRQYGKDVSAGIGLIAKNFDQPYQGGRGANYITQEKFENIIKETAKTSQYAADSLRKQVMLEDKSEKKGAANRVGSRLFPRVVSSLTGFAKRDSNASGANKITSEARRQTGSQTRSSTGNTMATREARQENVSRSNTNNQASSPSLSQADLEE